MALSVGTRLGAYEIVSAIGAGGMSACGYAALAAMRSRQRRISVGSRRGWGPHDSPEAESLRSRPAPAALASAEARARRAGVGPREQSMRNSEALQGVGVGPHADREMLTLSPCRSGRWH